MLSLSSLAGWEEAVLASVGGASGAPDERYRQIERSGMYGEYPAIIRAYVELFDDAESAPEAVKRAVFLVWRGSMASPDITGIADLPQGPARQVVERLDHDIRRDAADPELEWMMAWYLARGRDVFELLGGTPRVLQFGASLAPESWRTHPWPPDRMRMRGQMGRYWDALAGGAMP